MSILTFLSSPAGRLLRIIAGAALIIGGAVAGGGYLALAVIGLVPLAAGILDFCVLAPLAKMPFTGKAFRNANSAR